MGLPIQVRRAEPSAVAARLALHKEMDDEGKKLTKAQRAKKMKRKALENFKAEAAKKGKEEKSKKAKKEEKKNNVEQEELAFDPSMFGFSGFGGSAKN